METKKKSIQFTPEQIAALKKYRKKFSSNLQLSLAMGMNNSTVERILEKKSASPENYQKVISILESQTS